jgi:hypothetical protein
VSIRPVGRQVDSLAPATSGAESGAERPGTRNEVPSSTTATGTTIAATRSRHQPGIALLVTALV